MVVVVEAALSVARPMPSFSGRVGSLMEAALTNPWRMAKLSLIA